MANEREVEPGCATTLLGLFLVWTLMSTCSGVGDINSTLRADAMLADTATVRTYIDTKRANVCYFTSRAISCLPSDSAARKASR